jgi:hypothetical protein
MRVGEADPCDTLSLRGARRDEYGAASLRTGASR